MEEGQVKVHVYTCTNKGVKVIFNFFTAFLMNSLHARIHVYNMVTVHVVFTHWRLQQVNIPLLVKLHFCPIHEFFPVSFWVGLLWF